MLGPPIALVGPSKSHPYLYITFKKKIVVKEEMKPIATRDVVRLGEGKERRIPAVSSTNRLRASCISSRSTLLSVKKETKRKRIILYHREYIYYYKFVFPSSSIFLSIWRVTTYVRLPAHAESLCPLYLSRPLPPF